MTRDELQRLVDAYEENGDRPIFCSVARQLLAGPTLEQMGRWFSALRYTDSGWDYSSELMEMGNVIARMKKGRSDE